jgi:hypothetical protein
MFLLELIEQNRNNAKAELPATGIPLSDQWLEHLGINRVPPLCRCKIYAAPVFVGWRAGGAAMERWPW